MIAAPGCGAVIPYTMPLQQKFTDFIPKTEARDTEWILKGLIK